MIHFAGPAITIDERYLRQRCAWCGAVLSDVDLLAVAVPEGQEHSWPHWPDGALVDVQGGVSFVVPLTDDGKLPEGTCAHLDPVATI